MFLGLSLETWIAIASVAGPALLHIFGKINIPGLPPVPVTPATPVQPMVPNGVFPILPNGPLAGHPVIDMILNAAVNNLLQQVAAGANPSGNPPVKV